MKRLLTALVLSALLLPVPAQASLLRALRDFAPLDTVNLILELGARKSDYLALVNPLDTAARLAWKRPSGEARAEALLAVAGELEGRKRFEGNQAWLASLAIKELGTPRNERSWSMLARALSLRASAGFADEVAALDLAPELKDRVLGVCAERLARDGRLDASRRLQQQLQERALPLDRARAELAAALARAGLRREALAEARLVGNGLWKQRAFRNVLEVLASQGLCRELPELAREAAAAIGGPSDKATFRLLSDLLKICHSASGKDEALWLANRITDPALRVRGLLNLAREDVASLEWVLPELRQTLPFITEPEARLEVLVGVSNLLLDEASRLRPAQVAPAGPAPAAPTRGTPPPPDGDAGALPPPPPPDPALLARVKALDDEGRAFLQEAWALAPKVDATVLTSPRFAAILAMARWQDCGAAHEAARVFAEGLDGLAALSAASLGCFRAQRQQEADAILSEIQDDDWRNRAVSARVTSILEEGQWSRAAALAGQITDPLERLRLLARVGLRFVETEQRPDWGLQTVLAALLYGVSGN